ncbi:uncharacterized protein LOC111622912 [Centruroides sculpturatus]|uniref:uncharacterized protein LOC111622912 n=1 Tax=Centruroides sculpturatus TaxID=218467 RepID=UPI000C6D65A8|nr:uncharacterized protein LOC111622912 [Centruroides sculpturatus]
MSRFETVEVQSLRGESHRYLCDQDILRLLNFPNDTDWRNTLLLIVDPGNGPYDIEDFVPSLRSVIDLKDIVHFGASVVTHVYIIGMKTENSASALLNLREIQVKGRKCRIIPIENRKVIINIHWLTPVLSHDLVNRHFINYGRIVKCEFLKSAVPGLEHVLTNKRRVWLELKQGISIEELPYFIRVKGMTGSVVIADRPLLCYRCKQFGHIRRNCLEKVQNL